MQECFCNPKGNLYVPSTVKIVFQINRLASFARKVGMRIVWIREQVGLFPGDWQHYYDLYPQAKEKNFGLRAGNPGGAFFSELNRKKGDWEVIKNRFSPFAPSSPSQPNLDKLLRSNGIDTVIITGTDTNICCDNAARDAMNLDYKVIVVDDACCSYDDELHLATLESLKLWYAMVCSTEELIAEIISRSSQSARGNSLKVGSSNS